jgi:hypothetical protein
METVRGLRSAVLREKHSGKSEVVRTAQVPPWDRDGKKELV